MANTPRTTDGARFPPRVRFNWGYHDGARDAAAGHAYRYTHFDRVWLAGWQAGHADARAGRYVDDSTRAWRERQARA